LSKNLDERAYIVTGGSKGFGLAIAECLIREGARVGLIGRNAESLEEAVAMLGMDHAYATVMDVSTRDDIASAFEQVRQHFGRLDGLVNNAGIAKPGAMGELIESEVVQQVSTNFMGTVFACQAALPLIEDSDNPRLVNISSASAEHHDEMAHLSIYAASKAAVERFSRDLRREIQDRGIGVTILRPGAAMTEFAADWDTERMRRAINAWHERGPGMDTGMQPFHVGDAVAYCLGCPPGVSIDLLEIRPNTRVPKVAL